jgi:hypothetical protein
MNPFDVSNEHGIYPGKEFQSEKHWSHLSVHLVCMYRTSCCIAQTSITNANILKSHSTIISIGPAWIIFCWFLVKQSREAEHGWTCTWCG